jgi:hypothetical protein
VGSALASFLFAFACGVCAQASAQNAVADLGGTSWQLVKFEGGRRKSADTRRQFEIHGRLSCEWSGQCASGLQPWDRDMEIFRTESTPVRTACSYADDVLVRPNQRTDP